MTIKPLECYDRRYLIATDDKLRYLTSKGAKLIIPGMIFGVRVSHDGKKFRCILNDEVNKVFTITDEDYFTLMHNSVSVEHAIEEGYITN